MNSYEIHTLVYQWQLFLLNPQYFCIILRFLVFTLPHDYCKMLKLWFLFQWRYGCLGLEKILLPKNVVKSRWYDRKITQLRPTWKVIKIVNSPWPQVSPAVAEALSRRVKILSTVSLLISDLLKLSIDGKKCLMSANSSVLRAPSTQS